MVTLIANNSINTTDDVENNSVSNEEETDNVVTADTDYPKYLERISEISEPDIIFFYYNGKSASFDKNTEQYNEIITLNNARDNGYLGVTQLTVDLEELLSNGNIIEYKYNEYGSIYFNLDDNCVFVENNQIFYKFIYGGLKNSTELLNYLLSLV